MPPLTAHFGWVGVFIREAETGKNANASLPRLAADLLKGPRARWRGPWTVSDFSLMDAMECGIVKLPRVPVAENIPDNEMLVYDFISGFHWRHGCYWRLEEILGKLRRPFYDVVR
jgi:hypothetical protein